MDPVSVIGVAATLVTLFDAAIKLVYNIRKITTDTRHQPVHDYPELAHRMSLEPEIGIFRRFGTLNNLSLLYMQAELAALEREFIAQKLADETSACETTKLYSHSMDQLRDSRGEGGTMMRDKLVVIQGKLKDYSKISTNREDAADTWGTDKALSSQLHLRQDLGPGSADIRSIREITVGSIIAPHENLWKQASSPTQEKDQLADFVVLSPISANRSPFSASRADRGLVYKLEYPFRVMWAYAQVLVIVFVWAISEYRTKAYPSRRSRNTHAATTSDISRYATPPPATGQSNGNHLRDDVNHPLSQSGMPRSPSLSNDIGHEEQHKPTVAPLGSPSASSLQSGRVQEVVDIVDDMELDTISRHRTPATSATNNQRETVVPRRDVSSRPRVRRYPVNSLGSTAPQPPTSLSKSFGRARASDSALPQTPRQFPWDKVNNNPALATLSEKEEQKLFTKELSSLDQNHGPDLASSLLSALFTTIPVLVLCFIHTLPIRLVVVILFTIIFALALSLTYKPTRGEVFATTAA